jgi:cell division protein FtsL
MTRLNIAILLAVLVCALATVTSTHHARLLFIDLENEQNRQKQIGLEWNQLQLEQSTWAKHALVESIAVSQLAMHNPDTRRIMFVAPGAALPAPQAAPAAGPAPGTTPAQPSPPSAPGSARP